MSDFVSVKAGKGMRVTISRAYAEGIEGVEVLDLPATDRRGRPLPASRLDGRRLKPKTTVKKAVAKKAADSSTPIGGAAASSPEEAAE